MKIIKHIVAIGLFGFSCLLSGCATRGVIQQSAHQPQYILLLPVAVPVDVLTFPLQYELAKSFADVN